METLKYYLRLGGKDALLALPAAALLTLVFVLLTRKKREPDKREKLRWFLSFWYLCLLLLLVFLGGRVETRMPPFSAARLYPFDTLRRALISPDRSELTLLVLNVLSFVPFGLLLVRHARGREHGARLFWLLPLLPLLIELTQFATGLGTLEIDDWIANTVGGAWGVCMGLYYANRKTKKARTWGALALLPLLIAALGAGLWLARPFGFLPEDFADPALPRPAEVEIESPEELPQGELPVYRLRQPGREAAAGIADRLFGALGLERKTDMEDAYDDFTVYWALHSNAYVWVFYSGDFMLTIREELLPDGPEDEALSELLRKAGYELPAPSAAEEGRLAWDMVEAGGCLWDGEIRFRHMNSGMLRVDYALRTLDPAVTRPAPDAAAVRSALLRGRFSVSEGTVGETIGRIECLGASLVYEPDTKGFYRPLYALDCLVDGAPATLLTPAS